MIGTLVNALLALLGIATLCALLWRILEPEEDTPPLRKPHVRRAAGGRSRLNQQDDPEWMELSGRERRWQ